MAGTIPEPEQVTRARQLQIRHGDREFAALSWGPKDGRRVLALHGWLDNAASFSFLGPRLGELNLVAVDLPGHGLSPHRGWGFYHFTEYVLDVIAMAQGLGWDSFDLLGHSLGAGIATLVAGAFPERVGKVALIEGLGSLTTASHKLPAALRDAWQRAAALERKQPPSYADFDEAVRARAAGGGGVSEAAARVLCERGLRQEDGRWYWRNDARLTLPSPQRLTESQVIAFIEAIEAPVLLIRAKQGLPFDEQRMSARLAAVKHLRFEQLAGGHHLHMGATAGAVADVVREHFS